MSSRPPAPNGSPEVAFGEGEEGMSGLWKCARHEGKERTRRPAPVTTSVGRLGYSLASRSSANVASASPSHSDGRRDALGGQLSLPEALHAFFTSAAQRRALFVASVSASSYRSTLQSDEPYIYYPAAPRRALRSACERIA